ncbi:MAG: hypothetical protein JWN78_827 [Bacteroidota bacterium]|nr:hypothetical protein [Bacteroidota bacterium]
MRVTIFNRQEAIQSFFICLLFICAPSIIHLNIFSHYYQRVLECVLFFTCCSFFLFRVINYKEKILIGYFEFIIVGYVLFVVLRAILFKRGDLESLLHCIFYVTSYFILKLHFNKTKEYIAPFLIVMISGTVLFYLIDFLIFTEGSLLERMRALYSPNKSIFGILVASQLMLIGPVIVPRIISFSARRKVYLALIILFVGGLILLLLSDSRSGWLGFITSIFILIFLEQKKSRYKNYFVGTLFLFLSAFTYFLFFYKYDSSSGRLLVYKIGLLIFKDHWLNGVGFGQFKEYYNNYQAAYFAHHSIDSKEALLADNTFYAFNDYWQLLIEQGVIGLGLIGSACFLFARQTLTKKVIASTPLVCGALASLLVVGVAALFSYPLQTDAIIMQSIVCIAILEAYTEKGKYWFPLELRLAQMCLIALSLLFLVFSVMVFQYRIQSGQALALSRSGFKKKSLLIYEKLSRSGMYDRETSYAFAQELYAANNLQKAQYQLDLLKVSYPTNDVYKLAGIVAQDLKHNTVAENALTTAIYIAPNRVATRYQLLEFYLAIGDTAKAVRWAYSIRNMKIKVPSTTANFYKNKAKEFLEGL